MGGQDVLDPRSIRAHKLLGRGGFAHVFAASYTPESVHRAGGELTVALKVAKGLPGQLGPPPKVAERLFLAEARTTSELEHV
jgi:hypothetical protein